MCVFEILYMTKNNLALDIKDLTKVYSNSVQALKDFSMTVEDNSFLALLGKNGAGKTTFMGIISSLIKKSSGKVYVSGYDLDKNVEKIKSFIGIVPQEINLPVFEKPMQVLINQAGYFGIPRIESIKKAEECLKMLDLWSKRNHVIRSLSGGMKRRLMLARSLMHDPTILFLDEPTAGVDIEVRYKIWDMLKSLHKSGKTIILTTHYLEEAEKLCDKLAIIDKGKILSQVSMSSVLKNKNGIVMFDVEFRSKFTNQLASVEELKKTIGNHQNISVLSHCTIEAKIDMCLDSENNNSLNGVISHLVDCGIMIKNVKHKSIPLEDFFNSVI